MQTMKPRTMSICQAINSDELGGEQVRLIDLDDPTNKDFLSVTQPWIKSSGTASLAGYRRPLCHLVRQRLPAGHF